MPRLQTLQYTKGSNLVVVHAYVEDMVQVVPATAEEPPQFGGAYCSAVLHWDGDPYAPGNKPTFERVEQILAFLQDHIEWYPVPPIEFPGDA